MTNISHPKRPIFQLLALGGLALFVAACSAGDATTFADPDTPRTPASDEVVHSPREQTWLPPGATSVEMTRISEVADDRGTAASFYFRTGSGENEPKAVVEVMSTTALGKDDLVDRLGRDGATPLEIFSTLAPDEKPPQELVDNHRELAELAGRGEEVRDFSETVAQKLSLYRFDDCTPNDLSAALDPPGSPFVVQDVDSSAGSGGTVQSSFTTDRAYGFLGSYSCSADPTTTGSCNYPARHVTIWACSSGGCGHVEGDVPPCRITRLHRSGGSAGRTYGVTSERVNNETSTATGVTAIATGP